jgi:hypothetical protein
VREDETRAAALHDRQTCCSSSLINWEYLAGHCALAGGEVVKPEDPAAVDGVVDGLPGLEAAKRRLRLIAGSHTG